MSARFLCGPEKCNKHYGEKRVKEGEALEAFALGHTATLVVAGQVGLVVGLATV